MKIFLLKLFVISGCVPLLVFAGAFSNQVRKSKLPLPTVLQIAIPTYPALARFANVEGVVHLKITTDGRQVAMTQVEDGPKLLAPAAEENVRTWRFAAHEPTSFRVTYRYRLVAAGTGDGPALILKLPASVEVRATPRIGDPSPDAR